jgi:hypothetical protein
MAVNGEGRRKKGCTIHPHKKKYTEGSLPHFNLRKTHGCHKHIWWYSGNKGGWVGSRAGPPSHAADKNLSPLPRIEPKILGRPDRNLKTIATAPSRICDKKVGIFWRGDITQSTVTTPYRRFGTTYRVPS